MEQPCNDPDSDALLSNKAVFIDTSLDTHLAVIVSSSDTICYLKKKILHEHPLYFPKFGKIKIHGLKVKRRGSFYHLPESMLVKSAFDRFQKSWFISVDAFSTEESTDNRHLLIAGSGSADGVNKLPEHNSQKMLDVVNLSLTQDESNQHVKQKVLKADQLGLDIGGGQVLNKLMDTVGYQTFDHGNITPAGTSNKPDSHVQDMYDQHGKEHEIQRTGKGGDGGNSRNGIDDVLYSAPPEESLENGYHSKKKHKSKKSKIVVSDIAQKESDVSINESGKSKSQPETKVPGSSLAKAGGEVAYDTKMGSNNIADEPNKSSPIDATKRSRTTFKRSDVLDRGTQLLGGSTECTNGKHENNIDVRCNKILEDTSQPKLAAKRKCELEQENDDEGSVKENKTVILGLKSKKSEPPGSGKRKRKKNLSNLLNQGISTVLLPGIDDRCKSFGLVTGINTKDLGEEPNVTPVVQEHVQGLVTSERFAMSQVEKHSVQEVVKRHSQDIGNVKSRHEGSELGSAFAGKITSETMDTGKSLTKTRKTKKAKDLLGEISVTSAERLKGSMGCIISTELEKPVNEDQSSVGGTKEQGAISLKVGNEGSVATDKEIDDVIQNVVESVQQSRKSETNAKNSYGTSRKKTKKKHSLGGCKELPRS